MTTTIQHLRQEIKRYSDLDILAIKDLVDKEHTRRFEAEKISKQLGGK